MSIGMESEGYTIWLTGLPCSGKSTLATYLRAELVRNGVTAVILDGDDVRRWLTRGLGFSREDRQENIRRIAHVARLLTGAGVVAIVAAVSPYRDARQEARVVTGRFVEVYVKCRLQVCVERDVKGMYRRALTGQLSHFTGISDPYEPPATPELVVDTDRYTVRDCVQSILERLAADHYLCKPLPTAAGTAAI
jgi:adenylyl-sulfate kinase